MKRHDKLLLGFSLPFTALCAIPIIGPLLIGYAQASVADLFYKEIQNSEPSLPAQELSEV